MSSDKRGFTLIELLIVIGIMGLLAAAVLVAVAPLQRMREARNARRWAEVYSILNAMLDKEADDKVIYDGTVTAPFDTTSTTAQIIVRDTAGATCGIGLASTPTCPSLPTVLTMRTTGLDCLAQMDDDNPDNDIGLVDEYLIELPIDPLGDGTDPTSSVTDLPLGENNTGYYINRTNSGRIEVGACYAELGKTVRVKR